MTTKLIFPNVKDRTDADPAIIISKKELLNLVFDAKITLTDETDIASLTIIEPIKQWVVKTALKEGWANVSFVGEQAILHSTSAKIEAVVKPVTGETSKNSSSGSIERIAIDNNKKNEMFDHSTKRR